jgi:hypothetical protein
MIEQVEVLFFFVSELNIEQLASLHGLLAILIIVACLDELEVRFMAATILIGSLVHFGVLKAIVIKKSFIFSIWYFSSREESQRVLMYQLNVNPIFDRLVAKLHLVVYVSNLLYIEEMTHSFNIISHFMQVEAISYLLLYRIG